MQLQTWPKLLRGFPKFGGKFPLYGGSSPKGCLGKTLVVGLPLVDVILCPKNCQIRAKSTGGRMNTS